MVRKAYNYANGGQVNDHSASDFRSPANVEVNRAKLLRKQEDESAARLNANKPRMTPNIMPSTADLKPPVVATAPAPRPAPAPAPRPAPRPAPAPAAGAVDRSGNRLGPRPQVGQADAATRRKMLDEALAPGPPVKPVRKKATGVSLPAAEQPKHGGETYDDIVNKKSQ